MDRQAEERPHPTGRVGGGVSTMVVMVVMMIAVTLRILILVVVDMKHTEQKEHHQQAAQHPRRHGSDRQVMNRMREKMQHRNRQHQPGNKAHHELQSGVSQADQRGQPSAGKRTNDNQQTIDSKQEIGGHGRNGQRFLRSNRAAGSKKGIRELDEAVGKRPVEDRQSNITGGTVMIINCTCNAIRWRQARKP